MSESFLAQRLGRAIALASLKTISERAISGTRIMNDDTYEAGMKVRRAVLGDAHVDKAIKNTTPLNNDFQDFITRYGWGEIWARPGFDHRTRRILVLGTMMGLGRWEEFRMHLSAALRSGMAITDIQEIFMQQAIYCGLPITNTAFHLLNEIVAELRSAAIDINGLDKDGTISPSLP